MTISIEKCQVDAPEVQALAASARRDKVDLKATRATDWYLARVCGVVVATGAVMHLPSGAARLKGLFVAPAARGHGVGIQMLDHVMREAIAGGSRIIEANVITSARAYLERGFVLVGHVGKVPTYRLVVRD